MQNSYQKRKLSSVQLIVLLYVVAVIVPSVLLWLPIFHKRGVSVFYMDALFTGVSAISVTGLTVVNTSETFNTAGVIVLALIFQLGGIGIMTLGTFLWIILGRKIGLKERRWIALDQNLSTLAGLVALMKAVLSMTLVIETIGTVILAIYFHWTGYFPLWHEALLYGFFSSLSAFTNSGFDIFGDSLQQFSTDYFVQAVHIILLILGAIGFPVLFELKDYWAHWKLKKKYHFSLYSKITSFTFFALLILGALVIYLLEKDGFLADKTWHEAFFYSLFNSVSTRSGGLVTMDIRLLSEPTLLFMSILMFIGASPSSVGGGIRTTTFIVTTLAIVAYMKGRSEVKIFKRELHQEDVTKSFVVVVVAIGLVTIPIMFLSITESFPLLHIVFEVCSAFGTSGLSLGITPELSNAGKVVLMVIMFIGRIGIINFLFLLKKDEAKTAYHYPKEKIIIG